MRDAAGDPAGPVIPHLGEPAARGEARQRQRDVRHGGQVPAAELRGRVCEVWWGEEGRAGRKECVGYVEWAAVHGGFLWVGGDGAGV